ncbi:MAG: pyridoxamine 5'-phosphate oxidase family protein [Nitrososphaerales archaeon]|jgi:nitroimidazol reductase NimA-like FMN-containing flavoprotein (pyridoxamine 5'-phosphate oxidase superfamily)
MRVREAEAGVGMTEAEAKDFLVKSKSNMMLGTIDAAGNPCVHPVWYYFDPQSLKLYMFTDKRSAKASNIKRKDAVYFDVDDDRFPYKGVRGRGHAKEVADKATSLVFMEKILARYIKPNHPLTSKYMSGVKGGGWMVVEITPAYFTAWDMTKVGPEALKAYGDAVLS